MGWQARESEIEALVQARHPDPFGLLGLQTARGGMVLRAFVPGAETVAIDGLALQCRHPDGFFEALLPGHHSRVPYRLQARNTMSSWEIDDPYRYGPVLGPTDDHLFAEGTHQALYARLGAHLITHEGSEGVHFAVWAPNAKRVSVVGDFNAWDGRRHQMRRRIDSGVWEIFAPGVASGAAYKYEIIGADGVMLPLKADPVGCAPQPPPSLPQASPIAGKTRNGSPAAPPSISAGRRSPSMRCISAPGCAARATASSAMTIWRRG